jgi:hypothetical protein
MSDVFLRIVLGAKYCPVRTREFCVDLLTEGGKILGFAIGVLQLYMVKAKRRTLFNVQIRLASPMSNESNVLKIQCPDNPMS